MPNKALRCLFFFSWGMMILGSFMLGYGFHDEIRDFILNHFTLNFMFG